jgi:3-deoxy-D-manno-octulosonic-acid transferase
MMRALYSLVVWVMQAFVRRKVRARAALEPMYGEHINERFGEYDAYVADGTRPLIWIHAVSLGETRAAAILLKELRGAIPHMRLLLTNGTATGRAEGAKLLQKGDVQVWQAWDTRGATRCFFSHFKPNLGILLETEVWPNLIASAQAANVPVSLVNARMSEKSLKKTLRLKWLASEAYSGLTQIYAQTQGDASRLELIGAKVNDVFGNLKFDITPNPEQLAKAQALQSALRKPVILFASSREGEEEKFLNALKAIPDKARASAHWLIVPRHPQRFDEVAQLIEVAGFATLRRSSNPDFDMRSANDEHAVWLGDTLGEMMFYYGLSSAALLGGSFEPLGGQNLIEALACGCPVVMGPHTFNFDEAATLAAAEEVAFRVETLEAALQLSLVLGAPNGFERKVANDFVAKHRGAAVKTAAAIQKLLV